MPWVGSMLPPPIDNKGSAEDPFVNFIRLFRPVLRAGEVIRLPGGNCQEPGTQGSSTGCSGGFGGQGFDAAKPGKIADQSAQVGLV